MNEEENVLIGIPSPAVAGVYAQLHELLLQGGASSCAAASPLLSAHKGVRLHVDRGPVTQDAAKHREMSASVCFSHKKERNRSSRTRRQRVIGYIPKFHRRNSFCNTEITIVFATIILRVFSAAGS